MSGATRCGRPLARGSVFAALGSYLEGKGLPLVIPWAIVVLNVVVTMLNSLFERRREISILSSVGLNPAEIASIFVAEASITGFIAGGLGYLAGLAFYKLMPLLGLALEVHQKVSAVWSLAAIGISISAVLVGALAALRSSIVITPSLTRKWKLDDSMGGFDKPWEIPVPVRLEPEEVDSFVGYLQERLRGLENDQVKVTSKVKVEERGTTRIVNIHLQVVPGDDRKLLHEELGHRGAKGRRVRGEARVSGWPGLGA